MPVINNATVATGTGLSTAGNGGRKLVRLSNGWLVSLFKNGNVKFELYVSKNDGVSFEPLCELNGYNASPSYSPRDATIISSGNKVHVIATFLVSGYFQVHYVSLDALTASGNVLFPNTAVDTNQTAIGNVSLAINEAGTELHAAWSSKNATYPNSFNIRYAKGTINPDGSVTWGAVEQVTNSTSSGYDFNNISLSLDKDGVPIISFDSKLIRQGSENYFEGSVGSSGISVVKRDRLLPITQALHVNSQWSATTIFVGSGTTSSQLYLQSNPVPIFVPQSINGLANGRLWVAWHGKDAIDSTKFNVRVSYSDDGGVTWSTPVKLTTGNLYDRQNVSLAADKTGKVFALYEDHQRSPDLNIYMRTFSGGSWGDPVAVAEADPAAESNPSAFVDFSLQMTTPPFVFMSGTDGIKFSGNFYAGAEVSPVSGLLGNKETPTLTSYTVTPENGSTVTQIVEKLNGVTVNTYNSPASLSRTFTVPQVNWDDITFWYRHTAEIIVTDSNGAVTTTKYTFVKGLANEAPILEGVAATEDAYERISDIRDTLAAQVGLSAGSTFDAISAQLVSGTAVVKRQTGALNASTSRLSSYYYVTIPFSSIGFVPKSIHIMHASNSTVVSTVNIDGYVSSNNKQIVWAGGTGLTLDGVSWYIDSTGVQLPIGTASPNLSVRFIAYG